MSVVREVFNRYSNHSMQSFQSLLLVLNKENIPKIVSLYSLQQALLEVSENTFMIYFITTELSKIEKRTIHNFILQIIY